MEPFHEHVRDRRGPGQAMPNPSDLLAGQTVDGLDLSDPGQL